MPEPSVLALFGTGLLGIAWRVKARLRTHHKRLRRPAPPSRQGQPCVKIAAPSISAATVTLVASSSVWGNEL